MWNSYHNLSAPFSYTLYVCVCVCVSVCLSVRRED
jgi:hypothetical protein